MHFFFCLNVSGNFFCPKAVVVNFLNLFLQNCYNDACQKLSFAFIIMTCKTPGRAVKLI